MPPRLSKQRGKTAPPIPAGSRAAAATTTAASKPAEPAAAEAASDPNSQVLAPKDAALLQQVFTHYEDKKYSASVKTADLVLKKYPRNAQTLCMKGLSTYNLGKREEGKALAKKGLEIDPKSHVCWHVSALIYRADRDYAEAARCYKQGHRIEPSDLNILRDLINLQLFLRQYEDAAISRLHLVRIQPRIRYNWVALAVTNYLAKNYSKAIEVLDAYTEMLENVPPHDFDYSEVQLFRAEVYIAAGQKEKAQELLEREGRKIVDVPAKKELGARLQREMGKVKAAELAYAELLEDNPDNKQHMKDYLACRGITLDSVSDSNRQEAIDALQQLSDRLPRSRMIRRAVLTTAVGETFKKRLSAYIIEGLTKGIPSLFSDLKRLLDESEEKKQAVLEVVLRFKALLESGKTIEGDEDETDSPNAEPPTTYVWLLYLLSQIYSHIGEHKLALSTIELGISHTPSLPDLYLIKARILKRSGAVHLAEEALSQARAMDGQDRYLNGKHIKYLLRINQIEESVKVAGLFTRQDVEPTQDLTDMQSLWFLNEQAEAYRRSGDVAMALKRLTTLERVFSEVSEDELEFHGYCMRKFTLRSSINMARAMSLLRKHPHFIRAARTAIDIYIGLSERPYSKAATNGASQGPTDAKTNGQTNGSSAEKDAGGNAGLSEQEQEEKRKAEKKAKKAEAKAKAAAAAAEEEKAKKSAAAGKKGGAADKKEEEDGPDVIPKEEDEDPKGEKLAETKTPLEDAELFAKHLEQYGSDVADAQELIVELAFAKKEHLRALKALVRFKTLSPDSPALHLQSVRFAHLLRNEAGSDIPESVLPLIKTEFSSSVIPDDVSLEQYNTTFLQQYAQNSQVIFAAAQAQYIVSSGKDVEDTLASLQQLLKKENKPSLPVIVRAIDFLKSKVLASDESKLAEYISKAREVFPLAVELMSSDEVEAQKKDIESRREAEKKAGNEDAKPEEEK